jgi:hypothetical protein
LPQEFTPGRFRRLFAIGGVAAAAVIGGYGYSAVAGAQTTTTTPPATTAPGNTNPAPSTNDPNCPNMGGAPSGTAPAAPTSYTQSM